MVRVFLAVQQAAMLLLLEVLVLLVLGFHMARVLVLLALE
jgi:hypothetical protein